MRSILAAAILALMTVSSGIAQTMDKEDAVKTIVQNANFGPVYTVINYESDMDDAQISFWLLDGDQPIKLIGKDIGFIAKQEEYRGKRIDAPKGTLLPSKYKMLVCFNYKDGGSTTSILRFYQIELGVFESRKFKRSIITEGSDLCGGMPDSAKQYLN
jgi:hypothetical protein